MYLVTITKLRINFRFNVSHYLRNGYNRKNDSLTFFYLYGIRNIVRMEVNNCYTYQYTNGRKYGKLPAKVAE